jgi:hypothetical protein
MGVVAISAAASASAVSAHFGASNQVIFSRPVALPGVALPRGSYTFQVGSFDRNTHEFQLQKPEGSAPVMVRVTSRNGRTVHFEGFTWRVPRPADLPPDEAITLGEAPRGEPTPIRAWYPIGEQYGHKFVW